MKQTFTAIAAIRYVTSWMGHLSVLSVSSKQNKLWHELLWSKMLKWNLQDLARWNIFVFIHQLFIQILFNSLSPSMLQAPVFSIREITLSISFILQLKWTMWSKTPWFASTSSASFVAKVLKHILTLSWCTQTYYTSLIQELLSKHKSRIQQTKYAEWSVDLYWCNNNGVWSKNGNFTIAYRHIFLTCQFRCN